MASSASRAARVPGTMRPEGMEREMHMDRSTSDRLAGHICAWLCDLARDLWSRRCHMSLDFMGSRWMFTTWLGRSAALCATVFVEPRRIWPGSRTDREVKT